MTHLQRLPVPARAVASTRVLGAARALLARRSGAGAKALVAVAACALALAADVAAPESVAAQSPVSGSRLFVPFAGAAPLPDPCTPSKSCDGGDGWTAVCGGSGRVRDMFTYREGGTTTVVAVGDGVATYDPGTGQWQSQVGSDLTGLNSLYVSDAPHWWAVGERNRIARYEPATGCWRAEDDGRLIGPVNLASVMVGQTAPGGWSVGSVGDRGLLLRLEYVGGEPSWLTVSQERTGPLPALSDLHVFDSSGVLNDAWMVSATSRQVLRARLGTDVTGTRSVVEVTGAVDMVDHRAEPAVPLEIAMASRDSGWIAGETDAGDVVAWRFLNALNWAAELVAPDQRLLDLYQDESRTWWLGVTPGDQGGSVVRYNDRADGQGLWQSADRRSPVGGGDTGSGSRAVAPLDDGRVIYANGDGVWLHEGEELAWRLARQRRRIVGVAPNQDGSGGWAVADTEALGDPASELLAVTGFGVRALAGAPAPGDPALPRLNAVDGGTGVSIAVGENGMSLVRRGSVGQWQPIRSLLDGGSFTDVAVSEDNGAWASMTTEEGGGALYRLDWSALRWLQVAETSAPLLTVAALDGDLGWAVGSGTVCECVGTSCECHEALRIDGQPLPLSAVAAAAGPGRPEVWAAGEYILLRRGGRAWRARDARGVTGIPRGAAITDMAAGAADDLWLVATCNPYGDDGRGVSLVNHVSDTRASPGERIHSRLSTALSVPVNDIRVRASGGSRAVWVAGDWSTVASAQYEPGRPPLEPDGGSASDLWCLESGEAPRGR